VLGCAEDENGTTSSNGALYMLRIFKVLTALHE